MGPAGAALTSHRSGGAVRGERAESNRPTDSQTSRDGQRPTADVRQPTQGRRCPALGSDGTVKGASGANAPEGERWFELARIILNLSGRAHALAHAAGREGERVGQLGADEPVRFRR